jgi:hypothetical protein
MEPGPSTFRANVSLDEMHEYMARRDMEYAIITDPDGVYLGVLWLKDIH